jgi:hypothetical protein
MKFRKFIISVTSIYIFLILIHYFYLIENVIYVFFITLIPFFLVFFINIERHLLTFRKIILFIIFSYIIFSLSIGLTILIGWAAIIALFIPTFIGTYLELYSINKIFNLPFEILNKAIKITIIVYIFYWVFIIINNIALKFVDSSLENNEFAYVGTIIIWQILFLHIVLNNLLRNKSYIEKVN